MNSVGRVGTPAATAGCSRSTAEATAAGQARHRAASPRRAVSPSTVRRPPAAAAAGGAGATWAAAAARQRRGARAGTGAGEDSLQAAGEPRERTAGGC